MTTAAAPTPAPTPTKVDATKLAWLAETAHGLQGKNLALVLPADGGEPVLRDRDANELQPGDRVLFDVFTEERYPPMVPPDEVSIDVRNTSIPLLKDYPQGDALFWSASAVEKFLFPYYYSQRLLSEQEMGKLKASYRESGVVAILHVAPSKAKAIRVAPIKVVKGPKEVIDLVDYLANLKR